MEIDIPRPQRGYLGAHEPMLQSVRLCQRLVINFPTNFVSETNNYANAVDIQLIQINTLVAKSLGMKLGNICFRMLYLSYHNFSLRTAGSAATKNSL